MKYLLLLALATACGKEHDTFMDAPGPLDGPGVSSVDANTTLGPTFRFAVVGDTRPANEDDIAAYPTAVITKIWADVEAFQPHPDFAISTGDYMFASPYLTGTRSTVNKQLDLYLTARAQYSNVLYPAMGNHECTGATASNCGSGLKDGVTPNYTAFLARMLGPLGVATPYYSIPLQASDGSWTAKIVVIAANSWNPAQATWLDGELAKPTTYTFVVRHESVTTTETPGVTPSDAIINKHPLTLRIVGHTHTYEHYASDREIINGNGGAPLTSGMNFGYAIVERLASGDLQVTEHDYMTNAATLTFRIHPDGSAAP